MRLSTKFTFLSGSTNRWDILSKHCSSFKDLTPKLISTTRWSARINAVKPLHRNLDKILATLDEISESSAFTQDARHEAASLADYIDFKFVCSICIWHDILEHFDRVSRSMQRIESNIGSVVLLMRDLTEYLESYKSDGYHKAVNESKKIAEQNDITAHFQHKQKG